MQLHGSCVKIASGYAIHNQLRGIHYRTVTLPGLKLFAILSFPDRCDANFLLRVHTAGIGYPRAIPFGLKALSTSHRLYPSTSERWLRSSPSLFLSFSRYQKYLFGIHEPVPVVGS